MEGIIAISIITVLVLAMANFAIGLLRAAIRQIFSPAGAILAFVAIIIFVFGGQ